MTYITNRIVIVAISAVLVGAVAAGCSKLDSNPDNIPGTPATVVKFSRPVPQTNATAGMGTSSAESSTAFGDAANIWSGIEAAKIELDTAIKTRNFDLVHAATSKIRDLVKSLPDKSSMLSEEKRNSLDAHVKNVNELAMMMDKFNDLNNPNEMKSATEHQAAMNDALNMMKKIYPEKAMQSSMHMPDMSSSNQNSSADTTPGKGMSGMDDKMSGMGKPTDAGKMGGMDMMNKMTSGLSSTDKNEMKMIMGKMAAMPPAERKQAMQKMSGMGISTDPAKQADPTGAPMPAGGMGGHM